MSMNTARAGPDPRRLAVKAAVIVPTVAVWAYLCVTTYETLVSPGLEAAGGLSAGSICGGLSGSLAVWETLAMWMVMMVAMMAPAVLPWAIALARHERAAAPSGSRHGLTALFFLSGHFTAWSLFAVAATVLQYVLAAGGVLSASLMVENSTVRGVAFLVLGAYQWSPLKDSCLKHCESPFIFFLSRWRDGPWGALVMGAHHGLYCVGCCWLSMSFMVAVGAMSPAWMAGFTLYILAEMYVPELRLVSRVAGGLLMLAGLASLAAGAWS
jgi:predicted metal-binding membrane protein